MSGCCEDDTTTQAPRQAPVSWCSGNFTYTFANGRVTVAPRVPLIPDGVYPNATVTTINGCITSIAAGANVVYSACDPCVTPPTPTPTAAVPIDGDSCNLSSYSPVDGLLTQLIALNSSCIRLSGCGNAGSPLIAEPVISPDAGNALECRGNGLFVPNPSATVGVNFSGCGITITNGLWTSIPLPFAPILNLISTTGTVIATQSGGDPCTWDLSAVADPTLELIAQAFRFDSVAELPPQPTGSNGFAVIGAANPREVWMFVQGFGWRQLLDSTATGCQVNL